MGRSRVGDTEGVTLIIGSLHSKVIVVVAPTLIYRDCRLQSEMFKNQITYFIMVPEKLPGVPTVTKIDKKKKHA